MSLHKRGDATRPQNLLLQYFTTRYHDKFNFVYVYVDM
jgi:hypothetical protein